MALNTDLALELLSYRKNDLTKMSGVSSVEYKCSSCNASVNRIDIFDDHAASVIGKPIGRYITVEFDRPVYEYSPYYNEMRSLVTEELSHVCPESGALLFVGLGNRSVTPDAVGPLAADKVFATAHIKSLMQDLDTAGLTECSVLSPGVMAQTGFETSSLVSSACKTSHAKRVIVCDALACHAPEHMGRTIQLSSAGISPGSGVDNSRNEISEKTLGVPVAAVGIPTVSRLMFSDKRFDSLFVTPKSVDRLIERSASLIADAVNMFLHPSFTAEEIASLI